LRSANRLAIKIHKLRPEWKERTIRRALVPKKSLATRSVWPSPFPRYGSSQEEAVHCKKPSENAKNRRQNSCSN
jgi:hypothetical protein